jgi:hypothetical protein
VKDQRQLQAKYRQQKPREGEQQDLEQHTDTVKKPFGEVLSVMTARSFSPVGKRQSCSANRQAHSLRAGALKSKPQLQKQQSQSFTSQSS